MKKLIYTLFLIYIISLNHSNATTPAIVGNDNFDVLASAVPTQVTVTVAALVFQGVYNGTTDIQTVNNLSITAPTGQGYDIELTNGNNHDGTNRRMKGNGSGTDEYIKYELRMDNHSGQLWEGNNYKSDVGNGAPQIITIYGTAIAEAGWSAGDSSQFSDNVDIIVYYT